MKIGQNEIWIDSPDTICPPPSSSSGSMEFEKLF